MSYFIHRQITFSSEQKKDAKSIDLVKRPTCGIFSDEPPSPVNKRIKKKQFSALMKSILEIKAQNCLIISNQERIFNQLAVNDCNNCLGNSLEKEYSINHKKCPLKNNDDLDYIEGLLKDDLFYQYLSKIISMYVGSDIGTFVKNCLDSLFTNSVRTNITITGKINKCFGNEPKLSMKTLKLFNVICESGRNKFPNNYTHDIVIKTTSSWLRHSKERLKRKEANA
eukprot:XP_016658478.1 PREDICTED: uncharacterized protein LOC107883289 isoform X2 [Acyrthosiphon pisum]